MAPFSTSSQISSSLWSASLRSYCAQSEKFTWLRACSTSSATAHDTGATKLYQGQRVWCEWQSLQARFTIALAAGDISVCASTVRACSIGGLVRSGW